MQVAFLVTAIVLAAVLIVLIFLQSGRVRNIGSSIIGTQNVELFEGGKKRGMEKVLYWITGLLVVAFVACAFAVFII